MFFSRQKNFFYTRKTIWNVITEPRAYISFLTSLYLVIGLSVVSTIIMFYMQPVPITMVFSIFWESRFLTFFLNWLPIFLTSLFLFFVFNSSLLAVGIISFVVVFLSIINRFMILIRNDPFFPWDIVLWQELIGVSSNFSIYFLIFLTIGIVFSIFAIFLSYCLVKTEKIEPMWRIIGSISCLALMFFFNSTLFNNTNIANNLPVRGNSFNESNQFNSRGFLYSFIFAHNTQRLSLPVDFNQQAVINIQNNFQPISNFDMPLPHIIILMSEAFTDVFIDNFDFSGFVDPYYHWRRLINSPNVIRGNIIVPNLGGGTADTEFDVLTAFHTRNLRGVPYSYLLVRHDFYAMPSLLKNLGYRTVAIHPGHSWFYNRQNVWNWFGFDYFYNIDYFDNSQLKGPYMSEQATMDKLIYVFTNHLNYYPHTPFFNFTVTIQNHGPYDNMYDLSEDYRNFSTDLNFIDNFTDLQINQLTNFFHGLADIDIQLGRLIDYFENHPEPIILLYYSDHMPGLGTDMYNIIFENYPDKDFYNITRLYTVPFAIWQNQAALDITPIEKNRHKISMPANMIITSNFLGGYLLELLDFTGLSAFWDFTNHLRSQFPVILEDRSFDINGNLSLTLHAHIKKDITIYRDWQFYKLFY